MTRFVRVFIINAVITIVCPNEIKAATSFDNFTNTLNTHKNMNAGHSKSFYYNYSEMPQVNCMYLRRNC